MQKVRALGLRRACRYTSQALVHVSFITAEAHAKVTQERTREQRSFRIARKQGTGAEEGKPPLVEVIVSETTTDRRTPEDGTKQKVDPKGQPCKSVAQMSVSTDLYNHAATEKDAPPSRVGTKKGAFLRSLRRKLDGTEGIRSLSHTIKLL